MSDSLMNKYVFYKKISLIAQEWGLEWSFTLKNNILTTWLKIDNIVLKSAEFNLMKLLTNLQNFLLKELSIKIVKMRELSLIKECMHHLFICRSYCWVGVEQVLKSTVISKTCHSISSHMFDNHDAWFWSIRVLLRYLMNHADKMTKCVKS